MEKFCNYHHERESELPLDNKASLKSEIFSKRSILSSIGVDINENIDSSKSLAEREKAITEASLKEQRAANEFIRW